MKTDTAHFITPDAELASVILEDPRLLLMAEHFGIRFPLQNKTVREVCREHEIPGGLFMAISHLYCGNLSVSGFRPGWDVIPVILGFLQSSHAYYLDEKYPEIIHFIEKMKAMNDHAEVSLVNSFFHDYFREVREHMTYENEVAFPYIEGLYKTLTGTLRDRPSSDYNIGQYKDRHDDIGEKLTDLQNLLLKYLILNESNGLRRRLLIHLSELDHDLKVHALIEDLILIPLVSEIERHLTRIR